MKIIRIIGAAAVCLACSVLGAYTYSHLSVADTSALGGAQSANGGVFAGQPDTFAEQSAQFYRVAQAAPTDFTQAAEMSVGSVVHVKILQEQRMQQGYSDPFWQFFFGPRMQQMPQTPQVVGAGSGVIISSDGYIITNNHVVDGADKLQVTLNDRRSFEARIIGTDPSTDIALIKVEAEGLQPLTFGNSDALRVGEWVLAVGNPFNLTSTVTAGIVSAKSRSMGIINSQNQIGIESFIQTDAAVNPGNSGGALVNTRGELIGINTAIASTTGSYAGYSFAVPSNIVQKVAEDLKQYGEVQRAMLGVTIKEVTSDMAKEYNLERVEGVMVMETSDSGAARQAGILAEDVILSVDGERVNTVPELQERIARHRPGDSVKLNVSRGGKNTEIVCVLRNLRGTTEVVKAGEATDKSLGAELVELSPKELADLGARFGIKVKKAGNGKLSESGVKDGFVILRANRMPLNSVKDFERIVATASDGLFLSGVYPNGKVAYYAVNLQD